mgnify:CR=1 FL=1
MSQKYRTIRSRDRDHTRYPDSNDFTYEFDTSNDGLQQVNKIELSSLEISASKYTVEDYDNSMYFNEGICISHGVAAHSFVSHNLLPKNQFCITDSNGVKTTVTVPSTLTPATLSHNSDQSTLTTPWAHGLAPLIQYMDQSNFEQDVLLIGAAPHPKNAHLFRAGILLRKIRAHAPSEFVVQDHGSIHSITFSGKLVNSMRVGAPVDGNGNPRDNTGYLYCPLLHVREFAGVLSIALSNTPYRCRYDSSRGEIVISHANGLGIHLDRTTDKWSENSVGGMITSRGNQLLVIRPKYFHANVPPGFYSSPPSRFSTAVEDTIHSRGVFRSSSDRPTHSFVVVQMDAALQQRIIIPNGFYTPEKLVRVVNAELNGVTLTLDRRENNVISYTFSSDEIFPFTLDFSSNSSVVIATTFGFTTRMYNGQLSYSGKPYTVPSTTGRLPSPPPSLLPTSSEIETMRYPKGMYNITGTTPHQQRFTIYCDSEKAWSIPNTGQKQTFFKNITGMGVVTLSTRNMPTQQTYNFRTGDPIRLTGYNEESVTLTAVCGVDKIGTNTLGVEKIQIDSIGGNGYNMPPVVTRMGTDSSIPGIIPIIAEGKVVDFDVPSAAEKGFVYNNNNHTIEVDGNGVIHGSSGTITISLRALRVPDATFPSIATWENDIETYKQHDPFLSDITIMATRITAFSRAFRQSQVLDCQALTDAQRSLIDTFQTNLKVESTHKIVLNHHAEIALSAPSEVAIANVAVSYETNPYHVLLSCTVDGDVSFLPNKTAAIWRNNATASMNTGYRIKTISQNVITLYMDNVGGGSPWAMYSPSNPFEYNSDAHGTLYFGVGEYQEVSAIENVANSISSACTFTVPFRPNVLQNMKPNLQHYGAYAVKKDYTRQFSSINNNIITVNSSLNIIESMSYVLVSGTPESNGIWKVASATPLAITIDGNILPCTSGGWIGALAGQYPLASGTYAFDEQIVLYQEESIGNKFTNSSNRSNHAFDPLWKRAKNGDTMANDDMSLNGFLTYAPLPTTAHAILQFDGNVVVGALPAKPGFLSSANYLATDDENSTPPIVFTGGTLLDPSDTSSGASAKTTVENGHMVSFKRRRYAGARVSGNGVEISIVYAYDPQFLNSDTITWNGNNYKVNSKDARLRLVLENVSLLDETTFSNTITVTNFWPFNGTYTRQTSHTTDVGPASVNTWCIVNKNDSDNYMFEIELRAGKDNPASVEHTPGGVTYGTERAMTDDGSPPFAWAPSYRTVVHDDSSIQQQPVVYFGQRRYYYPSDAQVISRGEYADIGIGAGDIVTPSVTLVDELTTRVGIITHTGYDLFNRFTYMFEYNPDGIRNGEGFVDKAYQIAYSPSGQILRPPTTMEGVRTTSGNVSLTMSPVFSTRTEYMAESSDFLRNGENRIPQQCVLRRLGINKDMYAQSIYVAPSMWNLETEPYRLVVLSVLGANNSTTNHSAYAGDIKIEDVISKMIVPSSLNLRGYIPQAIDLQKDVDISNIRIQILNSDGTPYPMHGNEYSLTLSFLCQKRENRRG